MKYLNPWKENQVLRAKLTEVRIESSCWSDLAGKRLMEALSLTREVETFHKSVFGKAYNITRSLRFWVFGGKW